MRLLAILALGIGLHSAALAQGESSLPIPPGAAVIRMFDKDGIDKWAKCGWERLPQSAQNLIDYEAGTKPMPKSKGNPYALPQENLFARLNAVCGNLLAPGDRNTVSYGVKRAKLASLHENRPVAPAKSERDIPVFTCAQKLSGQYVIVEFGLEKSEPSSVLPGAEVDCWKLNSDGSRSNA